MATAEKIAERTSLALIRIREAAAALANVFEIEPIPEVRVIKGDRELARVVLLEEVAAFLERTGGAVAPPADDVNFDTLTVAVLRELLTERGVDLDGIEGTGANGNVVRADLIAALMEADNGDLPPDA